MRIIEIYSKVQRLFKKVVLKYTDSKTVKDTLIEKITYEPLQH